MKRGLILAGIALVVEAAFGAVHSQSPTFVEPGVWVAHTSVASSQQAVLQAEVPAVQVVQVELTKLLQISFAAHCAWLQGARPAAGVVQAGVSDETLQY